MSKALELAKFGRETPPTGVVVGDSDAQTLSSKTFSDMPVFSSGTTNTVAFLNASKVLSSSTSLSFDGSNLGIGVASPAATLDVYGGASGRLQIYSSASGNFLTSKVAANTGYQILNYLGSQHVWGDGTNTRMTIDASGNLGVGVASPGVKIDVQGASAGSTVARFTSNDTNTTTALAVFQRNGGAVSAAVKYNATNSPLTIDFGTTTNHALTFITADTERMRISSDGLAVTGAISATGHFLGSHYFNSTDVSGMYVSSIANNHYVNSTLIGSFSSSGLQVTGTISATGAISSSTGFSSYLAGGTNYVRLGTANYAFKFETPADNATLVIRRDDGNTGNIATFTLGGVAVTGSVTASATLLANNTSGTTQFRSGIGTDVSLATGEGLELLTTATTSTRVLSYSRTAGAFRTLDLAGSNVRMSPNNSTVGEFSTSGLTVTGTVTVNQNSTGVAGAFVNSDATNGYGVYIHAGGSSATRYALVVRDPAGNQDYFKISTVTGEVGHTIFRPGAYPSPEVARFTPTGLGIGTDNPGYKLHVTGNTYINGNFLQSALTSYQQQVITLSLNSTGWVKLFTMDSPGGCRVRYRAGSQNSEEIGEFTIKATYVAAGTQLTWSRQTYYSNINEIRVTGSNAGPYTVWALLRTTDYAPNLWWQVLEGNSYIALHNAVDTPGTAIATLSYPGYNSTNFATDATFSGNVGIGIISPTTKLTIKGQTHTAPWLAVERSGSTSLQFRIVNAENTGYTASTGTVSAPWTNVIDSSNSDLMLSTHLGGGTGGRIILDGKVGIGNTNPDKTLTVGGSTGYAGIEVRTTSGKIIELEQYYSNEGYVALYLDTTRRIQFRANGVSYITGGNVGIGTDNPSVKFQTVQTIADWTGDFKNYTAGAYGLRVDLSGSSGNQAALQVYTAAGNGLLVRNDGFVGIGTFNPTVKLEVNGEIKSAGIDINQNNNLLYFTKTGGSTGTSSNNTHFIGRVDSAGYHVVTDGGTGFASIVDSFVIGAKGSLILGTSTPTTAYTTGRVIIDQTGNVGIGTRDPTEKLHVRGIATGNGAQGPRINLQYSGTSGDAESLVNFLDFRGNVNAAIGNNLEDDSVGNYAARLVFKTAVGGTLYERMRINSAGYVTTPNQPSWCLRPNSGGNDTASNSYVGWTSNTSGSSSKACHITGVTLTGSVSGIHNAASSGRLTVPVAGKYKIWVSIRGENMPGSGNLYIDVNGANVARQHVEVWGPTYGYPFGTTFIELVLNLSANDYIETRIACGGLVVAGFVDNVNWFAGHLIG